MFMVELRLTFMPSSKFDSDPKDMMPWNMQMASRGKDAEMRFWRDDGSQRSALIVVAFWGYFAVGGMDGSIMSVRMTWYWGSWRRRAARRGPIIPDAPVIRILGMLAIWMLII